MALHFVLGALHSCIGVACDVEDAVIFLLIKIFVPHRASAIAFSCPYRKVNSRTVILSVPEAMFLSTAIAAITYSTL